MAIRMLFATDCRNKDGLECLGRGFIIWRFGGKNHLMRYMVVFLDVYLDDARHTGKSFDVSGCDGATQSGRPKIRNSLSIIGHICTFYRFYRKFGMWLYAVRKRNGPTNIRG